MSLSEWRSTVKSFPSCSLSSKQRNSDVGPHFISPLDGRKLDTFPLSSYSIGHSKQLPSAENGRRRAKPCSHP